MSKVSREEAIRELWTRGNLFWKCHPVQKEMYQLFYDAEKNSTLVWLLARQTGKSYLLGILACEQAIRHPGSIIKIATDTKLHIKSIFEKIFEELLVDCPLDLKPDGPGSNFTYKFPNGSQIQLAGTDNKHYEKLRGQKAHLVLVDEAGFCNELDKVIGSVLFPTTTHTGGNIVLASTPPEESDHDFLKFIEKASIEKKLTKKTIYDNPLLNQADIERITREMGGVGSERFRREYLCDIIKDSSTSVLPEVTPELLKEIVRDWPNPPFLDTYVSMDIAFNDLTALLFAYYDFRADKIIIQDEIPFQFNDKDNHLEKLSDLILDKEETLWRSVITGEVNKPLMRVSDINMVATNELRKYSGNQLNFQNARKDDKDSAINNVRILLANKKIIIHPKCTTLIRHLENVKWQSQNNKTTFARSPDNSHYDFVDALIYLCRSINFNKNPYPLNYDLNLRRDDGFIKDQSLYGKAPYDVYKSIFGMNKRNR